MKVIIPAHTSQRFNRKGKFIGTITTPELEAEVVDTDTKPTPEPKEENPELEAAVVRYFANMRLAAKYHMDNYKKPGFYTNDDGKLEAAPYDWEHSIQYYEGALVYLRIGDVLGDFKLKQFGEMLYNQFNGRDKNSEVIPWGELGATKYGLKKRSQWVFGEQAAHFGDETRLVDLKNNSCYMAYYDGVSDALEGRDLRGLAYLVDTWRPRNEVYDTAGMEKWSEILSATETASHTLGSKEFDLFYMAAMLGISLIRVLHGMSPRTGPFSLTLSSIFLIAEFISKHVEPDGRLKYGVGFIDDGSGGNETEAYYNELSLIIAPFLYETFKFESKFKYSNDAIALFIHGVNHADLITNPRAFCQNYRYSIDMALELAEQFEFEEF